MTSDKSEPTAYTFTLVYCYNVYFVQETAANDPKVGQLQLKDFEILR